MEIPDSKLAYLYNNWQIEYNLKLVTFIVTVSFTIIENLGPRNCSNLVLNEDFEKRGSMDKISVNSFNDSSGIIVTNYS